MDICDFHSHILPLADHGSSSVEVSIAQLKLAKLYGVNRIIATPHFYPHKDSVEEFIKRRNDAYAALKAHLSDDMPELRLAAEVLLCANMDELPDLNKLCIHGTKTILIELPFNDFGSEYVLAVKGMIQSGYSVVLAHAECYERDNIERMLDEGAMIQVNASALVRIFPLKAVESWKRRHKIVALGSDIHGEDKRAYKMFEKACIKLGDYSSYLKRKSDAIWMDSLVHSI